MNSAAYLQPAVWAAEHFGQNARRRNAHRRRLDNKQMLFLCPEILRSTNCNWERSKWSLKAALCVNSIISAILSFNMNHFYHGGTGGEGAQKHGENMQTTHTEAWNTTWKHLSLEYNLETWTTILQRAKLENH